VFGVRRRLINRVLRAQGLQGASVFSFPHHRPLCHVTALQFRQLCFQQSAPSSQRSRRVPRPPPARDLVLGTSAPWLRDFLLTIAQPGLSSLTLSPSETTVFKNGLQTVQRWLDRLPDAALSEFAEWLSPAARARLDAPAPPLSFGAATLLAPAPTTASPERDNAALVIYQPPLLRESTPLFLQADAEGEESGIADGIAEMEDVEITGARAVTPVRTVVVKTEPLDRPPSAPVEEEEVDELGSSLASPSPPAPKVATRTASKAASKATPKAPPPLRSAAAIRASVAFVADRPGREVRPPIVKEEETGELGELVSSFSFLVRSSI
jgi:hypothetical protein